MPTNELLTKYEFRWTIQPTDSRAWPEKKSCGGFEVEVADSEIILRIESDDQVEEIASRARPIAESMLEALSHQEGRKLTSPVLRIGRKPPAGPGHDSLDIQDGSSELNDKAEWTLDASHSGDLYVVTDSRSVSADESFDLARRLQKSLPLRQMVGHMTRFREDPGKRLAPLYDIIETAEAELRGEKNAPGALGMSDKDWKEAKRIMNAGEILTSRHPGESSGPKRVISDAELSHCIQVADEIIKKYAARILL